MAMIHRQVGKLRKRTGDDQNVFFLIKEISEYDDRLDKLLEGVRKWKESVLSLLNHQLAIAVILKDISKPIPGALNYEKPPDENSLQRIDEWAKVSEEMKAELGEQARSVDTIQAQLLDVRKHLQPLKKFLKKREDRKLDYERFKNSAESARKKMIKTEKDQLALTKAEDNLDRATQAYHQADEHIKEWAPQILERIADFMPYALITLNQAQHDFQAHSYTIVFQFAERYGIHQSQDIDGEWRQQFMPVKDHIEGEFSVLRDGKTLRKSIDPGSSRSSANSAANSRASSIAGASSIKSSLFKKNSSSRVPSVSVHEAEEQPPPAYSEKPPKIVSRSPSSNALSSSAAETPLAKIRSASSVSSVSSISSNRLAANQGMVKKMASTESFGKTTPQMSRTPSATSVQAVAAAKKKPPPPPPPKRKKEEFVEAIYSFPGQNHGDLVFEEGDRIKVIKKTDSLDDWWEGELNNKRGSFPANYCQPVK